MRTSATLLAILVAAGCGGDRSHAPDADFTLARLDTAGGPCGVDDSCTGFIEVTSEGVLRVDAFGGSVDPHEATISDADLAEAREVFGARELLDLLAMPSPCPPVTDSSAIMRIDTVDDSVSAQVAGCDSAPIRRAFELFDRLAADYLPATRIEIWARLPGVTATVEGVSTELSTTGGVLMVVPAIRASETTLVLDGAGQHVELPADWSADYAFLHLPADTQLGGLTLELGIDPSGDCGLRMTNGSAENQLWTGLGSYPAGACGPFAFTTVRLDETGDTCAAGDPCTGFIELTGEGVLRVDRVGEPADVREATIDPADLSAARSTFGTRDLLDVIASSTPCPGTADTSATLHVDTPLESITGDISSCTTAPAVTAARDLLTALADTYLR